MLRKDSPGAANIQGALHTDSYLGSGLDQYPRRRKRPRDQDVGKVAAPRTLYVCRPVLNADQIIAWAKGQGFPTTLPAEDMHVTIAFSKQPVYWDALQPQGDTYTERPTRPGSGFRFLERFGEATVLKFDCPYLGNRWRQFREAGASWDWPSYQPHLTISWQAPPELVALASPYMGAIVLGPEQWKEVQENWKETLVEKLDLTELHKKLGAKADASDYIDDFVNSDAPQFKGKSKEERIRMALGAYYNKMEMDYAPSDGEVQAWVTKIAKAGARHSRGDRDMIQTVHDHAVRLGADCGGGLAKLDVNDLKKAQVNTDLGLVMGYAIVCKVDGLPYYDLNIDQNGKRVPEHITEEAMLKAAADFMQHSRLGNEMHGGDAKGTYVFAYPLTTEIAKALGVNARVTGLIVAYKPPPDVLAKFKDGTYKGFSIEGRRVSFEEHDDE